jgi:hypothetical protein
MARRSKMLAKSKFGRPSRNGQGQAQRAARGRGEKKSQRGRDQIAALRAAGATMIYKEKISGLRADRPQLAK